MMIELDGGPDLPNDTMPCKHLGISDVPPQSNRTTSSISQVAMGSSSWAEMYVGKVGKEKYACKITRVREFEVVVSTSRPIPSVMIEAVIAGTKSPSWSELGEDGSKYLGVIN